MPGHATPSDSKRVSDTLERPVSFPKLDLSGRKEALCFKTRNLRPWLRNLESAACSRPSMGCMPNSPWGRSQGGVCWMALIRSTTSLGTKARSPHSRSADGETHRSSARQRDRPRNHPSGADDARSRCQRARSLARIRQPRHWRCAIDAHSDSFPRETAKACKAARRSFPSRSAGCKGEGAAAPRQEAGLLGWCKAFGAFANLRSIRLFPGLEHRSPRLSPNG